MSLIHTVLGLFSFLFSKSFSNTKVALRSKYGCASAANRLLIKIYTRNNKSENAKVPLALVCSRRHRRLIAAGISRGAARTAVETSNGVLSLPRCALLPGCQKWIICHPPAVFEARNKINVESFPCRAAVYSVCYVFNKNLVQEQWAAVCVWCRGARAASSISYWHRLWWVEIEMIM